MLVNQNKKWVVFNRILGLLIFVIFEIYVIKDFEFEFINSSVIIIINIILIRYISKIKSIYYLNKNENDVFEIKYVSYFNLFKNNSILIYPNKFEFKEKVMIGRGGARKYIYINVQNEVYTLSDDSINKVDFENIRQEISKYASNEVKDG